MPDITRGGIPYQTQSCVLGAAGTGTDTQRVTGFIRYLTIISATNKDKVAISFGGASFFQLPPGIAISGFESADVWIRNLDAVANTVLVASGGAELRDNRLIIDTTNPVTVSVTGNVASTIADGADVTQGAKADAAATTDAGTFSLVALIKRLLGKFGALVKSTYTVDALATTNSANVKATAGRVYSVTMMNPSAAAKFVRLYDKATAPTVGTDVAYRVFALTAAGSLTVSFPQGDSYANGIGIAITGAAAYNDATAVAAHDVQVTLSYE